MASISKIKLPNDSTTYSIKDSRVPDDGVYTDTTYTLTQDSTDGHKLTFASSSGSSTTITIPDLSGGSTTNLVKKEGDTMQGALVAHSLSISTSTVRNITASTTALTSGTSTLSTGDIYIQYI